MCSEQFGLLIARILHVGHSPPAALRVGLVLQNGGLAMIVMIYGQLALKLKAKETGSIIALSGLNFADGVLVTYPE